MEAKTSGLTEENKKALRSYYNLSLNEGEYNEMRAANKFITDTADMINQLINS